ncbi:MAG: hypothetical protein R6U20_03825 [Longimonas sp.]|uniref:hypothetical protein n=1 Tax=Longimonas sp. TaxID=2039626 RepID=UPI003974CE92
MQTFMDSVIRALGLEEIDRHIAGWMDRYGRWLLRISIAIVFIWFGGLKVIGISPAEELVKSTVYFIPADFFYPILAWWEVLIGITLLIRPLNRIAILLLFLQMPGTLLPLVILPEVCFTSFPIGLTMEGQYIIKNMVLISAGLVVGGSVRERSSEAKRL